MMSKPKRSGWFGAEGSRRREPTSGEPGFTLIELLVVILIVAILAAVAIPVFVRQREKGWIAAATASIKDASVAADSYAVTNQSYAGMTGPGLQAEGWNPTENVRVNLFLTSDDTAYCLEADHEVLKNPAVEPVSYSSQEGRPHLDMPCDTTIYSVSVGPLS